MKISFSSFYRRCRWHRWTVFRPCRWHRRKILGFLVISPWQGLIAGVNDTGDKFFVVDTAEQFIAVVNVIREYLREFSKKIKTTPMEYLGAWGTLIHEKNLKSKIMSDSFKFSTISRFRLLWKMVISRCWPIVLKITGSIYRKNWSLIWTVFCQSDKACNWMIARD